MSPRLTEVYIVREGKGLVKKFAQKFNLDFKPNVKDYDMNGADVAMKKGGNFQYDGWILCGKSDSYWIYSKEEGEPREISSAEVEKIIQSGKLK